MNDFVFKKKIGQNFLSDKNLLRGICADANVEKHDEILEIGAGAGSLTSELCNLAKRVVAIEIDKDLKPVLENIKADNLTLIFDDVLKIETSSKMRDDVLKIETSKIDDMFEKTFKLVANLPYYITSPIIFKFLRESKKVSSITIMVQKEVAQRMVAKSGSKDYGLLSVSCAFFGTPLILRNVSRKMFCPIPDVDSCVVGMKVERGKFDIDADFFYSITKACFKSRRKTILNNLVEEFKFDKNQLCLLPFDFTRRAEELGVNEFVSLAKLIANINEEGKSK